MPGLMGCWAVLHAVACHALLLLLFKLQHAKLLHKQE